MSISLSKGLLRADCMGHPREVRMLARVQAIRKSTGVTPLKVMFAGGSVRRIRPKGRALGSLYWAVVRRNLRTSRDGLGYQSLPIIRKARSRSLKLQMAWNNKESA